MFVADSLGINASGHLTLGGGDVSVLAKKYGTPLYLMDEGLIRDTCRRFRDAMHGNFGFNSTVAFAGKALCISYMYKLLAEEGLSADVVSGGEIYTAINAGFPSERLIFHGNNKTDSELELALDVGVGRFVVDNRYELFRLNSLACEMGKIAHVLFRIKPGIDAHTHDFVLTGQIDSKFGVALETGEAFELVKEALKLDNILLTGVHCHIGSQIFETEPFVQAADRMMAFMAHVRDNLGFELSELNLGGGFGIRYTEEDQPLTLEEMIEAMAGAITSASEKYHIPQPSIMIEPGRAIVAPAGITVYTVGAVKEIPGVRTYISVDGGMTDNPRYALYESHYEILNPLCPLDPKSMTVTLAGRNCESGDLIGKDLPVQMLRPGDLVAVLVTGAYNYSMASNYNRVPRPPIVMVDGGEDKLVVRRESYDDLIRNDVL